MLVSSRFLIEFSFCVENESYLLLSVMILFIYVWLCDCFLLGLPYFWVYVCDVARHCMSYVYLSARSDRQENA